MKTLIVPGKLESLSLIRQYVMEAAQAASLPQTQAQAIRLAIDEIATNVVTHGYHEAGLEGDLQVTAEVDGSGLTITLEDTGRDYNPALAEDPVGLDLPLEQRPIGGLGVFLAKSSVDRFQYERVGDRNRHTFVMNRPVTQQD